MNNFIKTDNRLIPLSWLYGLVVGIRNELFNLGILKSKRFDIPVIGIGNITVGGTGKTPHVEYLIRLLKDDCRLAVLSRGYLRKTKGFVLADKNTSMDSIGDESYQIKQKFPDITVAVDEKRVEGIQKLLNSADAPEVIILDDCYQHRYVKPGLNILLVDHSRMLSEDHLLPAGRLREPASERDRADIIIITKCPSDMKPIDFRVLTKTIDAFPYQKLFFSSIEYEPLRKFCNADVEVDVDRRPLTVDFLQDKHVLLLTGIAAPEHLHEDLTHYTSKITPLSFDDHHDFLPEDIKKINDTFASIPSPKMIITTEKDEARLKAVHGLSQTVKENLYILPIRMKIINDQEAKFMNIIEEFALKHSKNHEEEVKVQKPENIVKEEEVIEEKPKTISFTDF